MFSLNEDQVARFHRDGFLVIRAAEHGVFPPAQVYDWAYEVKSWPKENGKWMPYDEINIQGDRQLLRTENFADYHAGFDGLLRKGPGHVAAIIWLANASLQRQDQLQGTQWQWLYGTS